MNRLVEQLTFWRPPQELMSTGRGLVPYGDWLLEEADRINHAPGREVRVVADDGTVALFDFGSCPRAGE